MIDIITYFFQNFDIWFKIWILAIIIIIAASFRKWEFSWDHSTLGSVVLYIMIYPIYKEWYKYLSYMILEESVQICIFIFNFTLIVLLGIKCFEKFLQFLVKKNFMAKTTLNNDILLKFFTFIKQSKFSLWFNNLSIICSTWISTLGHIPFATNFANLILYFFSNILNTELKKKLFFGVLLFLPLVLQLIALLYDVFVEKKIYWFPQIFPLIFISLLTLMLFLFIEKCSFKILKDMDELIYMALESEPPEAYQLAFMIKKIGDDINQYRFNFIPLRKHLYADATQETYNELFKDFMFYKNSAVWCINTRNTIFNNFLPKNLCELLILEIIIQIIIRK